MGAALELSLSVTPAEGVTWELEAILGGSDFAERLEALLAAGAHFAARFRGEVASMSAEQLRAALSTYAELEAEWARLAGYVALREAADCSDPLASDLRMLLENVLSQLEAELRFFELEWLALDDAEVETMLASPELAASAHYLRQRRRFKPHALSQAEEDALALQEPAAESAWVQLYEELLAGVRVQFDAGDGVRPHTLPELRAYFGDPRRELRKQALEEHHRALEPLVPLLAHCYDTLVGDRLALDALRGFAYPRQQTDLENELEPAVVDSLLAAAESGAHLCRRWYRLKARLLGVDRLQNYDLQAPLSKQAAVSYQEAVALCVEAFARLDPELGVRPR